MPHTPRPAGFFLPGFYPLPTFTGIARPRTEPVAGQRGTEIATAARRNGDPTELDSVLVRLEAVGGEYAGKGGAFAGVAGDAQLRAVWAEDVLDDGQAQAGAAAVA